MQAIELDNIREHFGNLRNEVVVTCSITCSVCGDTLTGGPADEYYFAERILREGWATRRGSPVCPKHAMIRPEGRTTPEHITELKGKEIFVFGSNLAGRHGAGAALMAKERFGAEPGRGVGLAGSSYAIPTKSSRLETLSLELIQDYVSKFCVVAMYTPDSTFLVTEIGCGLAGYTPDEIAPMFRRAVVLPNVHLPKRFWDVLTPANT